MNEQPNNLVERIYLNQNEFLLLEKNILLHEHLRRYGSIRRFCYGNVLDFACGCGYGTFMLAGNPYVNYITGIDIDENAVKWAKKEYSHNKITYKTGNADSLDGKFDTLVCLETIEHIKDNGIIPTLVNKHDIDNLVISFPDKKTTHYNPYHFHDFVLQEIIDLFQHHVVYHIQRFVDCQSVMMIRKPVAAPSDIFRNIIDLR